MGRRTKDFLARQKKAIETALGISLTWDQYFERALSIQRPPRLTKEETQELKKLVAEARPWKMWS